MLPAIREAAYTDGMLKSALRFTAATMLASCAASEPAHGNASVTAFHCDGGRSFWVEHMDRQVRISTSAGDYLLAERPSSIGRKYSSETATFIHDEDRAALNGLPGGPFRRCRQVGPENAVGFPPLPEAVEIDKIDHDDNASAVNPDDQPS